eukprot:TRINITY_DN27725_c0_g1_i1.p1 TRINITY_DN27725_c0_g1~~TRINITY_DN27725_c0_g1_i1.p1  ORF type:complete len:1362 (+),score=186.07 TRINITY_DN27725_c0_g1_i1:36-4121(+)
MWRKRLLNGPEPDDVPATHASVIFEMSEWGSERGSSLKDTNSGRRSSKSSQSHLGDEIAVEGTADSVGWVEMRQEVHETAAIYVWYLPLKNVPVASDNSMEARCHSPTVKVGDYSWQVVARRPKGRSDMLALYLENMECQAPDFDKKSIHATFVLSVLDRTGKPAMQFSSFHSFNSRRPMMGTRSAFSWAQITDRKSNLTLTIEGRAPSILGRFVRTSRTAYAIIEAKVHYTPSSDSPETYGRSELIPLCVGLYDPGGAPCCLNPLLQVLFHIGKFREYVYSDTRTGSEMERLERGSRPNKLSLLLSVQRLFYGLQFSPTTVDAGELVTALNWKLPIEQNAQYSVREVFELLRRGLDTVNPALSEVLSADERLKCNPSSDAGVTEVTDAEAHVQSPKHSDGDYPAETEVTAETAVDLMDAAFVRELFMGIEQQYVRCWNVPLHSTTSSQFFGIDLTVKGCKNLEEALLRRLEPNPMLGKNQYYSPVFKYQDAEIGISYAQFPPVLTFHLKRWEPTAGQREKILDWFEYPDEINMGKYLNAVARRCPNCGGLCARPFESAVSMEAALVTEAIAEPLDCTDAVTECNTPRCDSPPPAANTPRCAAEQPAVDPCPENGQQQQPPASSVCACGESVTDSALCYRLHSVIVHRGGAYTGQYSAYIRVSHNGVEQWVRFDDHKFMPATAYQVFEDNFGDDPSRNLWWKQFETDATTAVALTYVDKEKYTDLAISERIPKRLQRHMQKWRTMEAIHQQQLDQRVNFLRFLVTSDAHLKEYWNAPLRDGSFCQARPICPLHERNASTYVDEFIFQHNRTFSQFLDHLCVKYDCSAASTTLYLWSATESELRPSVPVYVPVVGTADDGNAHAEGRTEVTVMEVFSQFDPINTHTTPIALHVCTAPCSTEAGERALLLIKNFDPKESTLNFVGSVLVSPQQHLRELLPILRHATGALPESSLLLFWEIQSCRVTPLQEDLDSKVEDLLHCGDIIICQPNLSEEESRTVVCPTVTKFFNQSMSERLLQFIDLSSTSPSLTCTISEEAGFLEICSTLTVLLNRAGTRRPASPGNIRLFRVNDRGQKRKLDRTRLAVRQLWLTSANPVTLYFDVLEVPCEAVESLAEIVVSCQGPATSRTRRMWVRPDCTAAELLHQFRSGSLTPVDSKGSSDWENLEAENSSRTDALQLAIVKDSEYVKIFEPRERILPLGYKHCQVRIEFVPERLIQWVGTEPHPWPGQIMVQILHVDFYRGSLIAHSEPFCIWVAPQETCGDLRMRLRDFLEIGQEFDGWNLWVIHPQFPERDVSVGESRMDQQVLALLGCATDAPAAGERVAVGESIPRLGLEHQDPLEADSSVPRELQRITESLPRQLK